MANFNEVRVVECPAPTGGDWVRVVAYVPARETMTVAKHTVTLDNLAVAPDAFQTRLTYGAGLINDRANSKAASQAKAAKDAGKKPVWLEADSQAFVDRFTEGKLELRGESEGGSKPTDPVQARAHEMALAHMLEALRAAHGLDKVPTHKVAAGLKGCDFIKEVGTGDKTAYRVDYAVVGAVVAANPALVEQARKAIEAESAPVTLAFAIKLD